jgi:amino acid permease
MTEFDLVLVLLCVIYLIMFLIVIVTEKDKTFISAFGAVICVYAMISIADRNHKPTAMDVIEGKTIMEYKIIDGIKVDSTLIFKPEFKK